MELQAHATRLYVAAARTALLSADGCREQASLAGASRCEWDAAVIDAAISAAPVGIGAIHMPSDVTPVEIKRTGARLVELEQDNRLQDSKACYLLAAYGIIPALDPGVCASAQGTSGSDGQGSAACVGRARDPNEEEHNLAVDPADAILNAMFAILRWSSNSILWRILGHRVSVKPQLDGQGMPNGIHCCGKGMASQLLVHVAVAANISWILMPRTEIPLYSALPLAGIRKGGGGGVGGLLTNDELKQARAASRVLIEAATNSRGGDSSRSSQQSTTSSASSSSSSSSSSSVVLTTTAAVASPHV